MLRRSFHSAPGNGMWLFMLWLWFASTAAAEVQYSPHLWQTEDGLPHNAVHAVIQTRDGYIWVGTTDGLARFDGIRFTVLGSAAAPELRGQWITALCETRDGSLWVGTGEKGLYRLQSGRIDHFNTTNGLGSDTVRCLFEDAAGTLWIGTTAGLTQFRNGKFINLTEGLGHPTVRALCQSETGDFWVGTAIGLNQVDESGVQDILRQSKRGPVHNSIKALRFDREGALWVGTDGGLSRFNGEEFEHFTRAEGLVDIFVNALHEDRNGDLWIGTFGGLNRMVGGRLVPEYNNGAPYDRINAICEDREGNIWLGTKGGLLRLNAKRFSSYTKQQGLSHSIVVSVYEDRDSRLWIGTWGGGVNCLIDGKITTPFTSANGLSSDLVLGLHQDRLGTLWAGTDYQGGLNQIRGKHITTMGKEESLTSSIMVILEDRSGTIWMGTRNGLHCRRGDTFVLYSMADGLAGNIVRALVEDADGSLWIGTDGGLSRWASGKFTTFGSQQGLPSSPIFALLQDSQRTLWIGMQGAGLSRLRNGKVSSYRSADGLFHDTIYEIIEDEKGFLWLTSPKGVFRVALQTFEDFDKGSAPNVSCVSYGKADGMVSVECTGGAKPSALMTRDGRLWFATSKGLVVSEKQMKDNDVAPLVALEAVFADKVRVHAAGDNQMSSIFPPPPSGLKMPRGRGELEFHYTALSLQAPEKNRFRYKLEGIDPDWVEAGTRRVAYYTNIRPGAYRFRVKACNNDGVWNETAAELPILLQPHLWETWWFRAAVALGGFGVILGANTVRRNRRREIERLRLRIAADLHDDIGSNLASIALLSQIEAPAPEREQGELSEINRIALSTAQNVREIVWFINPDYDTLVEMIARMKDAAANMLVGIHYEFRSPADPRAAKLSLEFRRNVFLLFKEVLHNIVKHANSAKVEIEIKVDDGEFHLRVADDGIGFATSEDGRGNGLKNIRLRAGQVGGQVDVSSQPGRGTTICLRVDIT